MPSTDDIAPARIRAGDVVMTVILLGVFSGAFLLALDWPFRAAFFPRLLSIAGICFSVLKLIEFAVLLWRPARSGPVEPPAARPVPADDEEQDDQSLEYVFGSAGARAWAAAVAWVAAFFVGLWLVGIYVIVPVFTLAYLRTAGKASWPAAALYAAVAGGVLWLAFTRLLAVPMPAGVL
ncbi:tripartite tricarboxylate transporter TctB family protein [Actinomadura sp. SCN-SB]|uniref:tripartite tricarboxylate transporter TctB family protein n=1 Tax=Actinomadura sp. SCN-SB TaxID=3373092 RepID=UPI003751CB33